MIIGRRTFVRSTALVGAASAVANLLSLSSIVLSQAAMQPGVSPLPPDAGVTDANSLIFKIDGWSSCDDVLVNSLPTPLSDSATNTGPSDQVWISINQSWRTAWR
jgi:hypothetical protein